ncbi:3'-5' exonuclease [Algiphilus sp. W345]|uniref:DNA 3'-5' helicase n=1 Tax=Banduia mediterranea TaxID=3075609 RepID=A0ABU2WIB2_9GAMM|nr:UvrD-helicase domain-containing protein [Algiphilus sp. W345]MDT0497026.1 3'-5' exonuclease [Algiphilus sp. W345]
MRFDDDDITPLLEGLNDAQREAVTAPPEHRLVLAGAGSGKTRVLVHRVAWLISVENVSPHSVLAVTFTNKAAAEMRHRLELLLDMPVRALWVGTFHGIAHRMLRLHHKEARLHQNFQIMDADDQLRFIKRVLRGLDLPEDRWPPKTVTGWINAQKEEARRPEDFDDRGDFSQRQLVRIYSAYHNACEQAGLVDFAELLLRAFELCRDDPAIRQHYRNRFRHILVDEFQDTNTLQYKWLRVLAGDSGKLFVVGDDDQCLAAGTPVTLADGSRVPIERIRAGDRVVSGYGSGEVRAAVVTETLSRGRRRGLVEIRTAGGRRLLSTPEHTHFARYVLGETPQLYFTYLMYKRGVGFRIGTSQSYTRGIARPKLGVEQRRLQEHADAAWILAAHSSESAARADEVIMGLRYAIPMLPFVARTGKSTNGLVHDQAAIARVFASLDTESGGRRLLDDLGLDWTQPHHCPQSRDSNRRNVVVTLCGGRRGASPMHRISIVGNDEAGREVLQRLGLSVREAKKGSRSWRFEICRKDFGEVMTIAERACKSLDAQMILSARLGRRSLRFVRAASLRPGMALVTEEGAFDTVESISRCDEALPVYDLNIEKTHNFAAGGLLTHNSVYSWRGARVENIVKFTRDFPGNEVVRLEQNYRSSGTILKAANGLIARNSERMGKQLWTDAGDGESIQLYAAFNDLDECDFVVSRIREAHERGTPLQDMAILYRSNAQSRVLEEGLIRARLAYRIYGGLRFFERMEIRDALAYLRLIGNRDDDPAFERVVNTPTRGIGNTTMERLRAVAREQGVSLWNAAKTGASALGRSAGKVALFQDLVDRLAREADDQALGVVMDRVIEQSGLREHYKKEKGEQAEARLENLDELVTAARSFEDSAEDDLPPMTSFLTHAALEAGERQAGEGEDCVQLMTLHAAKGLEFPTVFMVGLEEGLFPHVRAVQEGNIEEERRLCYVGITRSCRQLYLSYAELRRLHGQEQVCMPSRFVREIPAECVLETRPRSGTSRPAFAPRSAGLGSRFAGEPPRNGLKLGAHVRHPRFGEGVITAFDGEGDRGRVEVSFRDVGSKWLILSLAKLEAV